MSQAKLYVGNMPFSVTEAEIGEAFGAFGSVTSVHIATDRDTGQPRGFGFVEMSAGSEAQAAIDGLNGKQLGGRALVVNVAKPREPTSGGRGGQGGRRSW